MKEKKEREGWRLNKVAIIITVIWAVICLILMLIVYANDTENPQVSAVFFVLGAIPIVIVAVIESIRKKNFEEAERKKATEIRKTSTMTRSSSTATRSSSLKSSNRNPRG